MKTLSRGGSTVSTRTRKGKKQVEASTKGLQKAAAEAQVQALAVKEKLSPQVTKAIAATAVGAGTAKAWAGPKLEKGRDRGLQAAAPKVEAAAEKVAPAVDAARDKIIKDVIPRLVDAVNAAAEASAATMADAADATAAKAGLETARMKKQRRRTRRRRFVLFTMISAALAAGVASWRRSRPQEEPDWFAEDQPATAVDLTPGTTPMSEGTPSVVSDVPSTDDVPILPLDAGTAAEGLGVPQADLPQEAEPQDMAPGDADGERTHRS